MSEGGQMPAQPHNAEVWKTRGFDFICFVTRKGDMPDFHGAWFIEELPISWGDPLLNAELPKLNPQSVLEGYEYSVWIDEGTTINGDSFYENCKELQRKGTVYAHADSRSCNSVYTYAWKLWRSGLEPFSVIRKALAFLAGNGLFPWSGFHDTSVLFRAHENEAVLEFDRWWWECLLTRAGGHYDRLMHLFALNDTPSLKWETMKSDSVRLPRNQ